MPHNWGASEMVPLPGATQLGRFRNGPGAGPATFLVVLQFMSGAGKTWGHITLDDLTWPIMHLDVLTRV